MHGKAVQRVTCGRWQNVPAGLGFRVGLSVGFRALQMRGQGS